MAMASLDQHLLEFAAYTRQRAGKRARLQDSQGSDIRCVSVFLRYKSKTFVVDVDLDKDTPAKLASLVEERVGVPVEKQKLCIAGKTSFLPHAGCIEAVKSLRTLGVTRDASIEVGSRLVVNTAALRVQKIVQERLPDLLARSKREGGYEEVEVDRCNPALVDLDVESDAVLHGFVNGGVRGEEKLKENEKLELVFHGTPRSANVESIFSRGLDPALRGTNAGQFHGPGAYFSPNLDESMRYAQGESGQVLVLLLKTRRVSKRIERVIVAPEEAALPVAVLRVRKC